MSDKSLPLYRPSNGTEGDIFFESWCFRCAKGDDCEIPMRTMIHDTNEPEYPREWVRDGEKPRCTAFKKASDVADCYPDWKFIDFCKADTKRKEECYP